MPTLKIPVSNFALYSSYYCTTMIRTFYTVVGTPIHQEEFTDASTADGASKTVRFEYGAIPADAIIKSAKIHADLVINVSNPRVSSINGVHVSHGEQMIGVTLDSGVSYIDVPFVFQNRSVFHDHTAETDYTEQWVYEDPANNYCNVATRRWSYRHIGSAQYKDVYLEIEYEEPSDPTGSAGFMSIGTKLIMVPTHLQQ